MEDLGNFHDCLLVRAPEPMAHITGASFVVPCGAGFFCGSPDLWSIFLTFDSSENRWSFRRIFGFLRTGWWPWCLRVFWGLSGLLAKRSLKVHNRYQTPHPDGVLVTSILLTGSNQKVSSVLDAGDGVVTLPSSTAASEAGMPIFRLSKSRSEKNTARPQREGSAARPRTVGVEKVRNLGAKKFKKTYFLIDTFFFHIFTCGLYATKHFHFKSSPDSKNPKSKESPRRIPRPRRVCLVVWWFLVCRVVVHRSAARRDVSPGFLVKMKDFHLRL